MEAMVLYAENAWSLPGYLSVNAVSTRVTSSYFLSAR